MKFHSISSGLPCEIGFIISSGRIGMTGLIETEGVCNTPLRLTDSMVYLSMADT